MLKQIEITVSSSADICLPTNQWDKKKPFLCLKEVYEGESFEEIGKKRLDYLSKIVETYINNEIKKIKGGVATKPVIEAKVEEKLIEDKKGGKETVQNEIPLWDRDTASNSPFNNIK